MRTLKLRPITVVSIGVLMVGAVALACGPRPSVPIPAPLTSGSSDQANIDALLNWIGTSSMIEVRDTKVKVVNSLELFRELNLLSQDGQSALSSLILAIYARGFPGQSLSYLVECGVVDPYDLASSAVSAAILGLAATEPIDAIRFSNRDLDRVELQEACVGRAESAVRKFPRMTYLYAVASACNVSLYRQQREQPNHSASSAIWVSLRHVMTGLDALSGPGHLLVESAPLPELLDGKIDKWRAYRLASDSGSKVEQMSCLLLLGNYLEAITWLSIDAQIDPRSHELFVAWAISLIESIRTVLELGLELNLQLDLDIASAANSLSRTSSTGAQWMSRASSAFARAAQSIAQTVDCQARVAFIEQSPLYAGLNYDQLHCSRH